MLGPLPRTTFAHHPSKGGHEETRGHGLALRWPSSSRDDGENVESVARDAGSADSCGGCGDGTVDDMASFATVGVPRTTGSSTDGHGCGSGPWG